MDSQVSGKNVSLTSFQLPSKPELFVKAMQQILQLDLPDYIARWLCGERWAFVEILAPLLKCTSAGETITGEKMRAQILDGFAYFVQRVPVRQTYFTNAAWEKIADIIGMRLEAHKFYSTKIAVAIDRLRAGKMDEACKAHAIHLERRGDFQVRYCKQVDQAELLALERRYFTFAENLKVLSVKTLMEVRGLEEVVKEKVHYMSDIKERQKIVVDCNTREEIGGMVDNVITDEALQRMRCLIWEIYKGRPAVRYERGKAMKACGPYVNNRFCEKQGVGKDILQFYADPHKLFKYCANIRIEDQTMMERHLHTILLEGMMAITYLNCSQILLKFFEVHGPYLREDSVRSSNLDLKRGPPAYTLFFTIDYTSRYHIDKDAALWTVLLVSNPKNHPVHFALRSHNVVFRMQDKSLIYFQSRQLHATELTPLTGEPNSRTCGPSNRGSHRTGFRDRMSRREGSLVIFCMAVNGHTGGVLQSMSCHY